MINILESLRELIASESHSPRRKLQIIDSEIKRQILKERALATDISRFEKWQSDATPFQIATDTWIKKHNVKVF